MQEIKLNKQQADLANLGLRNAKANWNLSADELVQKSLDLEQGILNDTGALCVHTGKFTGRSPKDKFTVHDELTKDTVDWGDVNIAMSSAVFDLLYNKIIKHLDKNEIWVRDSYACADLNYRLPIRVVNETPWANLFCHNLFLRPTAEELDQFEPEWLILQAPSFLANPLTDGTVNENFTAVDFTRKIILIGGSAYTGEMKKGIFSVLNFILPHNKKVLSMHCSANEGEDKDVALFFGLSGTGKTTLSTDPNRALIGDDEHGWANCSVFNFEGGCYAKCIDLSQEKEPEIWNAVKHGALLENTTFYPDSNTVDFADGSITENTRVAYPINFIPNAKNPSFGGEPKNIFFLTCDAFGILPPISKLTKGQAMYHFVSGYTAKIAGTEMGIKEPQTTFSACFGRVFLPLHPVEYAELLGEKLQNNRSINVWLINTGWIGGPYGVGNRISLKYTRAMISSALSDELNHVNYVTHPNFGVKMPITVPNVPSEILNPRWLWNDKNLYDRKANELAKLFITNFSKYASEANEETLAGAPKII
ncbi:phosphoenolpyruvate carboxykinase (ATP) [Sphingobacterium hungaricum]|uniref:Phosphoenolpyruvate carboxykinase (ATP) n=1 Tax=Sphingobacterium hungaricum TaxID=2082723 RepID=A0A928YQX2_9SPHI|nr:phosphoenolpyruvate carboxykinase (ATP) [Sphingobacterium hungaricum]MBE8712768.1 phosphoenolpyruvate carboxykinase (ATP) [Sphingobacterium hungaricum]